MRIAALIFFVFIFCIPLLAQVTIGSGIEPEKAAILDIKEKDDFDKSGDLVSVTNGGVKLPRVRLTNIRDLSPFLNSESYSKEDYEKIKKKHTGLVVFNLTEDKDFVKSIYEWDGEQWDLLISQSKLKESIRKINLPRQAVFRLDNTIDGFFHGISKGGSRGFPVEEIVNNMKNFLKLSEDKQSITFQPGVYSVRVIYEALNPSGDCRVSSYFVDFPTSEADRLRIHSTAAHRQGTASSHGGIITATTLIKSTINWKVHLGRGQSSDCDNAQCTLKKISTQIHIERFEIEAH